MSTQEMLDLFGLEKFPKGWDKPYEFKSMRSINSLEGHRLFHLAFLTSMGFDTSMVKSQEQVEAEMNAGILIRDKEQGLQYSDFDHRLPILHPQYSQTGKAAWLLVRQWMLSALLCRISGMMVTAEFILYTSPEIIRFYVYHKVMEDIEPERTTYSDLKAAWDKLKSLEDTKESDVEAFNRLLDNIEKDYIRKFTDELLKPGKLDRLYEDPALIRHQKEQNRLRAKYHSRKR